jgi:NADP-dependent 3-hydroxy acid dehydrogenase YdfG
MGGKPRAMRKQHGSDNRNGERMPSNAMDFAGRTALITGASAGIGRSCAERLAAGGARVIACARRVQRLEALAQAWPGQVRALRLDVTQDAEIAALPAALAEQPVDILINNAGLAIGLEKADAARLEDWDEMLLTNVRALARLTRTLLPMLRQAPRADIINLSSVAGSYPYPGGNLYGASKAFVTQFSLNLRCDLLGSRVRVTSVEPGMTETEFSEVRFAGDAAKAAAVYQGMQPLTGADIAEVIAGVLALPAHVNVNRIEVMPVQQAFGGFAVDRSG